MSGLALWLLISLSPATALAQSIADFYRGRAVSVWIGCGAGGGNDLSARVLARHRGRHIPGEPAFDRVRLFPPSGVAPISASMDSACGSRRAPHPAQVASAGQADNTRVAAKVV